MGRIMDRGNMEAELQALRQRVAELEAGEKQMRTTLYSIGDAVIATDAEFALRERVKELNCLQTIGKIVEAEGSSISSILERSVAILPVSWLHIDSAVARIRFDGEVYQTGDMSRCVALQRADLRVGGEVRGAVEVGYVEQHSQRDEGPFLKEERALIEAVAERLGRVIERLEAVEALERERETLEAAFDGIDDVIYLADPETYELLHVNSPVKAIWGEDCIGRKCYEVLQGRDSPCPFCTNDRIFGDSLGEPYVWEFQNKVNQRWYRCSDKAVRWTDGRWVRFELAIDITAGKEVEQALRDSEERFRRITEVAPDMIYRMSLPDGAYEYVSPAAERIFGYQPQDFIDNPALSQQVIPSEWHGYFEREWQKLLADQAPPIYEYQIVHKSGEVRWLNQRNVVLHDDEGRPSAIWGIVTDVTETKEAELALVESKREIEVRNAIAEVFLTANEDEIFPRVLELVVGATGSKYGLFGFIDEEGDLVVPSMTRLLWDEGQSEDEEVVFPNDDWGDSGWLAAIREKELQHVTDASSMPQEGRLRIERSVAAPIVHQDRVIGVLQVTSKPTGYTERELELVRRLCESIAPILDARISHEQEEQRRKEAEEEIRLKAVELERSNEELEQFVSVASHDLQEPLRMVASFTQLLAQRYEGQLDDKADMYIGYAVDGAKRMQQLINDLLMLSRVSTRGRDPEPTDCNEVVVDVQRGLMDIIEENEAEVVVEELPEVLADASQLGQVFQNLIANAVKFRGEERPRVEVGARREGDVWELSVSDNGIGIDPEFHDRVFVIFQRLHERGRYSGSGIGLAIVKKIVERHGGRIWIDSALGEGTRFCFTMPAADALPTEEQP